MIIFIPVPRMGPMVQFDEYTRLYSCSMCGLHYRIKGWAVKCQFWHVDHGGSCSLEIAVHSTEAIQHRTNMY